MLLAGCGAGKRPVPRTTSVPPPLLGIPGSLVFACGEDSRKGTDAYFKDETGGVRRLTESQLVSAVRWLGDDVILASSGSGFGGAIYRRSLTTDPDVPGRRIAGGGAPAGVPAVSSTGALAFQLLGEERSGRLYDKVVVVRDGRRRTLGRFRWVDGLFWIRGRIYGQVRRRGITHLVDVKRRSRLRLGRHVGMIAATPDGRVAISASGRHRRDFTVMRVDGSDRRTFRADWYPLDWSPGGTRILVANGQRELGLLDPRGGRVTSLGASGCGHVVSADWRR